MTKQKCRNPEAAYDEISFWPPYCSGMPLLCIRNGFIWWTDYPLPEKRRCNQRIFLSPISIWPAETETPKTGATNFPTRRLYHLTHEREEKNEKRQEKMELDWPCRFTGYTPSTGSRRWWAESFAIYHCRSFKRLILSKYFSSLVSLTLLHSA